jgi:dipeptidyl-peptidase-4
MLWHKKPKTDAGKLIPGARVTSMQKTCTGCNGVGDECIKPGVDTLYSIQPKTGKETMVITREQINKVLEENKAGKLSHLYSVRFPWTDKAQMLFTIAGKFIVYDFKNNQVSALQTKGRGK